MRQQFFAFSFFSSHIRRFEKMLETKWQIDEDGGKGWSYEKTGNLFADFKTNPLEEKLVTLLSASKQIYNSDIYEFTLRNGFLPTHTVEVFNSLQLNDKLLVLSEIDDKVRKGAFYINYDNYKKNPKKVYFKMN